MSFLLGLPSRAFCRFLHFRVTPRTFLCFSALFIPPCFMLYLLASQPSHPSGEQVHRCFAQPPPKPLPPWNPALPPPAWSTPEERLLLKESMARWHFSAGMCEGCQAYHHKRVINPSPSICAPTPGGKNPDLLILVSTIHKHREHRDLIRETWGTYTQNNTGRARILYLFGKDPASKPEDQKLLEEEGATYGNILQDDFNSTYRRGGEVQLIMGYRWVVEKCSNIMHIVKVSDDVFVNIPRVLDVLEKMNLSNSIFGGLLLKTKPFRDKKHRWYTSPEIWPAEFYPDYVAGPFIGVTLPVLRKILLISPYIAWSAGADDVIVGLCAEKLGIPLISVPGIQTTWDGTPPCRLGVVNALHFHAKAPKVLHYLWKRRDCFEGGTLHRGPVNETAKYNGTI